MTDKVDVKEHDCPRCCEARACAERMRLLLPEAHALIARMHNALGDVIEVAPAPETNRFHNGG